MQPIYFESGTLCLMFWSYGVKKKFFWYMSKCICRGNLVRKSAPLTSKLDVVLLSQFLLPRFIRLNSNIIIFVRLHNYCLHQKGAF